MVLPVKLRELLSGVAVAAILALSVHAPVLAAEKTGAELETAVLKAGAPKDWVSASLPSLLNEADAARYRIVFEVQKNGEWKDADKIIKRIDDRALMGHVLAQRYLHPTKYRSRYRELKAWMADYADHPEAKRIYKLALRRRPKNWKMPVPPAAVRANRKYVAAAYASKTYSPRKKLTKAQRKEFRGIQRRLRWYLRKGWTKAFKKLITDKKNQRLYHPVELDRQRGRLATGYYGDGRDQWALDWSEKATQRSGKYLPVVHWTAGLAAWRLQDYPRALGHFDAVSKSEYAGGWLISAGAFWAARTSLRVRRPQDFNKYLRAAKKHPRTFYGLLAHNLMADKAAFNWAPPPLAAEALRELAAAPGGRRAVMLLQVGEDRRAEVELKALFGRTSPDLARAMLALADRAQMPSLAMRLGSLLVHSGSDLYDSTAYPAPPLTAKDGGVIDRELILALIRQESAFNPKAKSRAGARGLMQLMPRTASFVAKDRRLRGAQRNQLFDPELNLKLGQKYIDILLGDARIKGDLFRLLTAWNGGPGNLNKWSRKVKHNNDPLLFIESIPSRETRIFVERVLTNYWIYRIRFNQSLASMDAVARGKWPHYTSERELAVEVAEDGRE
jgi:soluble lytic murein transglycosylase-like protein